MQPMTSLISEQPLPDHLNFSLFPLFIVCSRHQLSYLMYKSSFLLPSWFYTFVSLRPECNLPRNSCFITGVFSQIYVLVKKTPHYLITILTKLSSTSCPSALAPFPITLLPFLLVLVMAKMMLLACWFKYSHTLSEHTVLYPVSIRYLGYTCCPRNVYGLN